MKKLRIYVILSGAFLALGIIGFAISPLIYDLKISKLRDHISEFEYYRQLASKNLYDSMDWYRYAGITSNNAYVLLELKVAPAILKKKKEDYINESKFSLNSLIISIHSAKGEFDINEKEIWNKWDGVTEPVDFFNLQKKYSELAMTELKNLDKKIMNKKNQINDLEMNRKWFWLICIIFQSLGMFLGTYHSYLKEDK